MSKLWNHKYYIMFLQMLAFSHVLCCISFGDGCLYFTSQEFIEWSNFKIFQSDLLVINQ
jgi:hypothetical protein